MKLAAHAAALAAGLLIVAAPCVPARAAEDAGSKLASLSAWFKNLKNGLAESAVSGKYQKVRSVSTVAAVRGDEQDAVDPNRPEWKTSSKSEKVALRKEKAELASAVELIVAGKYVEGEAAIDAFEKEHPRSRLIIDARKAKENAGLLAQLRGTGGAPKAPEASTTPAEEKPQEAAEKAAETPAEKAPAPEKKAAETKPAESKAAETKAQ